MCQVVDFPSDIFVEAHAARERLSKAGLLAELPEGPPEPAGVDYEADEEVQSGMVAEALSLMAAGTVDIKLHNVTVSGLPPVAGFWSSSLSSSVRNQHTFYAQCCAVIESVTMLIFFCAPGAPYLNT